MSTVPGLGSEIGKDVSESNFWWLTHCSRRNIWEQASLLRIHLVTGDSFH